MHKVLNEGLKNPHQNRIEQERLEESLSITLIEAIPRPSQQVLNIHQCSFSPDGIVRRSVRQVI